jgi:transposase InsO family protein
VNSHKNARLGFAGRVCLVERHVRDGWTAPVIAAAFGVSVRTVWKWVARHQAEGVAGLRDRTSRPAHSPSQVSVRLERRIARLRAQRRSGPQIADAVGLPLSTVGDVLRRLGLGRLPPLTPRPPVVRYERETPGELLHIDAKKLGKIAVGVIGHRITGNRAERGPRQKTGWECLHVAVDDASRVAYAELLPDETAASAVRFLDHAVAWLATLGVRVAAVMTDNAFCYTQRTYATALARHGLRHLRTRPYTPRTNGKAERFIQTALREWAYAKPYRSSRRRAGALAAFLTSYNTTRPHTAHGRLPPMSRLQP